jgi:hypothetical protein
MVSESLGRIAGLLVLLQAAVSARASKINSVDIAPMLRARSLARALDRRHNSALRCPGV